MAAYTAAYADIRVNDNARFRTQMGWIATQLETIGWAKQADSGQIDFSSVSAPGAADTNMGFEIRKTGDLYLKISYGSGYAAYSKALWLQFATGTDGAGGIPLGKELTTTRQIRTASGYSGGVARAGDDYVSGDADRLMIAMTDDTSSVYSAGFACMRQTDENGDYTTDGEWCLVRGQYQTYGDHFNFGTGLNASPCPVAAFGCMRMTRALGSAPSNIPISPVLVTHPTRNVAQFRDAYIAATSLVPLQSTITIDGRTYLSTYGGTTSSAVWGFTSALNYSLLLRYD